MSLCMRRDNLKLKTVQNVWFYDKQNLKKVNKQLIIYIKFLYICNIFKDLNYLTIR